MVNMPVQNTSLKRKLKVDELFTHEWKLNQAKEAYELFDKQSDGKGVIYPS